MIVIGLKTLLENIDMSQKELANRLNTSEKTISRLCRGELDRPSLELLNDICTVLQCDLHEILLYRRDWKSRK